MNWDEGPFHNREAEAGTNEAGSAEPRRASNIVIGLGNPILGDDSLGRRVAEAVAARLAEQPGDPAAEVDCLSLGGLALMERLVGYRRAIIIDALAVGDAPAGRVRRFTADDLPVDAACYSRSVHDATLQDALRIGRLLGAPLPERVEIVAVEICSRYEFSEELSIEVAAAVPEATAAVLAIIRDFS